jgi:sec-independent protein translocase protein TatA
MALGPLELAVIGIIVVVVVVMGPKKIPELARALGMAKKEFEAGQGTSATPVAPAASYQVGGDDLMAAAKRLGISTEGKTREQISAEIVRKTAGA